MRRLKKHDPPEILVSCAVEWTEGYLESLARQDKETTTPWRATAIRDSLRDETNRLCAYCESAMLHVAYDHIEHILPKSKFPGLVVEWSNLTLACPRCNVNKGSFYSAETPLLNPYQDEPEQHLIFTGSLVLPRPANSSAKVTVELLKLHRGDLSEARAGRIMYISEMVDSWARESGAMRDVIKQTIIDEWNDGAYYMSVKAYLISVGFPVVERLEGERVISIVQ